MNHSFYRWAICLHLLFPIITASAAQQPAKTRTAEGDRLIPPATPLVACDPYFSIWSQADKLTDSETTHWTGKPHRLTGILVVDGKPYRVLGASPTDAPALSQTDLKVLPTRTIYSFEGAGVGLTLTFMTAALPEDIDLLSRPVTYVTWDVHATDAKSHEVKLHFGASGELAVNNRDQRVVWSDANAGSVTAVKLGSQDQQILGKRGDDLRIDWGYLYLAAPNDFSAKTFVGTREEVEKGFSETPKSALEQPARGDAVEAAISISFGKISTEPVSRWLMIAYDDLFSIQYNHKNLRPYWRRNGWEAADLLQAAAKDYAALAKRCETFDTELMQDLTRIGGEKYARLSALAYRQCFAAGKFVADEKGQPLQFCKENHSNGCIATSDVFYPMSPQFLMFGPSIAKSFLVPFMNYAISSRWKFPFAPHDLGTYPHANGQVYGGGERTIENQMPVEESGNLLILMAAVAQMEGNANFAEPYWSRLEQWAAYLKDKGFDPENQLCTDDFAGHLAHNVNLSAKAICGLGAFARLCEMRGEKTKSAEYFELARQFAQRWVQEAREGDHFRLAFNRTNSWSQKYNLIWDRILGLNLFPSEVLRTEMDYYKRIQNNYGLPLDNRKTYTKLDWILWTATLTQNREDFEALVNPVYRFLQEAPDRSPMTDWYETKSARKVGFTARPVVGGVFAAVLYDRPTWKKYAERDQTKASGWAPMPAYTPPVVRMVTPTAKDSDLAMWLYTITKPGPDWFQVGFDDNSWTQGAAGFGSRGTPGGVIRTEWTTGDIWLRQRIKLPEKLPINPSLSIHHDEDVEIYINGVLAASAGGFSTTYETLPLTAAGKAALKPGKNVIAVHCHQTRGGQYIDVGLVDIQTK